MIEAPETLTREAMFESLETSMIAEPLALTSVRLADHELKLMTHWGDRVLGSMIRGEIPMCVHLLAEVDRMLELLPSEGTILDVGGNMGLLACLLAKASKPDVRVITIEPDPRNVSLLRLNAEMNELGQDKLLVIEAAAGLEAGQTRFFRSPDNFGDHRSHKPTKTDLKEDRFDESFDVQVIGLSQTLAALEPVIDRIAMVKIDTQGADLVALESCLALLDDQNIVCMEYSPYHLAMHGSTPDDAKRLLGMFDSIEKLNPLEKSPRTEPVSVDWLIEYFDTMSAKYKGHCDLVMTKQN